MIRLEALQLRRLAADVLRQLKVDDTAEVMEVSELTDGTWMVDFEDRSPDTRFPGFAIDIQQDWSPEHAIRELRLELRNKLWICPLCQRRSQIRRIIDREVFRVECDRCGRFEIEHAAARLFPLWRTRTTTKASRNSCPRLSEFVGGAGGLDRFCPRATGGPWPAQARRSRRTKPRHDAPAVVPCRMPHAIIVPLNEMRTIRGVPGQMDDSIGNPLREHGKSAGCTAPGVF